MKVKLAIVVLFLVGVFSCTQRTCPTYTKDSVQKVEKAEEGV